MNERRYYSEDAKIQARREMSLIAILAMAMGVGIGTVMALLFAPKDGESMREDLGHMAEKRFGAIEKQVGELRGKLEDRIAELT